jgi:two-component system, OmpR family, sensor histidine kinase KdpD
MSKILMAFMPCRKRRSFSSNSYPACRMKATMTVATLPRWRRSVLYLLLGASILALVSLLCVRAGLGLNVVAPVYLLLLVLQSLTGDFVSAGLLSVVAVAILDFFFVAPLFSFQVVEVSDSFALLAFLTTALVITQLVSRLREQVRLSKAQEQRLDRLYRLSQRLLRLEPDATADQLMEPFQELFGLCAISIFDGSTGELQLVGQSRRHLADRTKEAYIGGRDLYDVAAAMAVRCLQRAGKTIGAIGFEGIQEPEATIGPLVTLTSAYIDRMQAFRTASTASAAAQAEVYRSAILDALAHEFKTPLAVILTAVGGLREFGLLRPEQIEMAETAETEAERLGRLTSRLLRVAKLDREEMQPRLEMANLWSIVRQLADHYGRQWRDRKFSTHNHGAAAEGLIDRELLGLALGQLLDNACKYSRPGSQVRIDLYEDDGFVIEVSNTDSFIPVREQRLIFDRFYRGEETRASTAGSGLGLYVARKIALSHGGNLTLLPSPEPDQVTFRLKIPDSLPETQHAIHAK